ncbi:MAG: hypothetical protein IID03_12610 [Candidatus Dadabacteria bacterium]|nr:hypothetical protein [Candidatus Dadabacteria bacterium]
MKQTRFSIAKKDIISFFDSYSTKVLTYGGIAKILSENTSFWRLPVRLSVRSFVDLLLETRLKEHIFNFPHRKILRYTWGEPSDYNLFLSLADNSYFTHYTALYLHNLTDQIPKTIYLNFEQSQKRKTKDSPLEQKKIDFAFSRPQRESANIAEYKDYKICLINGQYTKKTGVVELNFDEGENLSVTNVERTLIDIIVRPSYAGGTYEILNAYIKAKDRVSINKLSAILKKLEYIYPYHQAIGFYLEKAKVYGAEQINLLKDYEMNYDFYLARQIKVKSYSKEWRLHYPEEFDI